MVSVNGLNEGVIAFYVLAAAYAAKLWLDHRQTDPVTARGYVWLAGWMAGSAASCKYTSVVFVVIPLSILVAVTSRRDWFRAVGACALAVTLACGPWFAKSWVQTGNPVYPLLASVFESQPRTPEQVASSSAPIRCRSMSRDAATRCHRLGSRCGCSWEAASGIAR